MEWNLRATGYVGENLDYFECWSLLRRASGAMPESLPLENQGQAEAVEEFLELGRTAQLALLASRVPRLAELLEPVRADHHVASSAESEVRQLVGPRSLSVDPLVRTYTARDVVINKLQDLTAAGMGREMSTREKKRRR